MTNNINLTLVRDALVTAADHLIQYRQYAEEMRTLGRGLYPSSPYSPELTERLILEALMALADARTPDQYTVNVTNDLQAHVNAQVR